MPALPSSVTGGGPRTAQTRRSGAPSRGPARSNTRRMKSGAGASATREPPGINGTGSAAAGQVDWAGRPLGRRPDCGAHVLADAVVDVCDAWHQPSGRRHGRKASPVRPCLPPDAGRGMRARTQACAHARAHTHAPARLHARSHMHAHHPWPSSAASAWPLRTWQTSCGLRLNTVTCGDADGSADLAGARCVWEAGGGGAAQGPCAART